jgi:arylsulfatase A-like enzyme
MSNKILLLTCFLGSSLLVAAARGADRANIVIILADDLGYADVGVHGCKDIPTPHIDALAASGVRCTEGYVSHPFCSPMRAGLMAGRYQHRFGYVSNVAYDPQNPRIGLPSSEKTIARRLQEVGYAAGMAGKWHLGASHMHHPNRRGFDDFYGFLGGGHDYFDVDLRKAMHEGYFQPLDRNGKPEDLKQYLTDALTDHAVAFIETHRDEPFFYYLAYNAPHTPMQAPEDVLQRFAGIQDERRRKYAAMVYQMDVGIGRVLKALDHRKLRENTLVFFLSDNGGPTFANGSNNDPLRGDKGDLYEGGVRVPFVASWPGQLPVGATYSEPVISLDISRTALEVGRCKPAASDEGVNLIPYLTGQNSAAPHQTLYWRKDDGTEWSVRAGPWKLVATEEGEQRELYNVVTDISESRNVIQTHREIADQLALQYKAWNAQNPPPLFSGFRQYHEQKNTFYQQMPFERSNFVKPKR